MTTIGFLHTATLHVATFDALVDELGGSPGAAAVHEVRPDLLAAARSGVAGSTGLAAALEDVVAALAARSDVVVCTCSTLGPLAERTPAPVPVVRVDRPAARAAVAYARIGVVVALGSTVTPTRDLLRDEALRAGREPETTVVLAEDAWALLEAGEHRAYADAVAAAARRLVAQARPDVVLLAQASMAPAAALLGDVGVPVLTTPRSAVAYALSRR